jgi:hypothetical protein
VFKTRQRAESGTVMMRTDHSRKKRLMMSMLVGRKTLFPAWLIVFGLLTLLWPPGTVSATLLVLAVGIAVPAIVLIAWKETPPTVAEVLHAAETNNRQFKEPTRPQ